MGQTENTPPSRRTTRGFAERTRRNLELAKQSFKIRGDFHVVTQLVNSLLGIVVVPSERRSRDGEEDFGSANLSDIDGKGWPKWEFTGEKGCESQSLEDFVKHFRNAAAHGHYDFPENSDSRHLNEVTIEVSDGPPESAPWSYKIRGDKLFNFCIKLSQHIERTQKPRL